MGVVVRMGSCLLGVVVGNYSRLGSAAAGRVATVIGGRWTAAVVGAAVVVEVAVVGGACGCSDDMA